MFVLPAIDIYGGKAVRLLKGNYSTAEQVAASPYEAAQRFAEAGATQMHMVDLDGAKDAKLVNADLIADVARTSGLTVEVGGGIRDCGQEPAARHRRRQGIRGQNCRRN